MYCPKCGNEVKNGSNFCGKCGAMVEARSGSREKSFPLQGTGDYRQKLSNTNVSSRNDSQAFIGSRSVSIEQIVIAVIAMVNVVFAPIYDLWGGLFPDNPDNNFWDVISGKCDHSEWIFLLTISIFIPSIVMLVLSVLKLKKLVKLTAGVGIALQVFWIVQYAKQYGLEEVFNFKDGCICIGFWFAFMIFALMLTTRARIR